MYRRFPRFLSSGATSTPRHTAKRDTFAPITDALYAIASHLRTQRRRIERRRAIPIARHASTRHRLSRKIDTSCVGRLAYNRRFAERCRVARNWQCCCTARRPVSRRHGPRPIYRLVIQLRFVRRLIDSRRAGRRRYIRRRAAPPRRSPRRLSSGALRIRSIKKNSTTARRWSPRRMSLVST